MPNAPAALARPALLPCGRLQVFNSLGNLGWAYSFSVILLEIQDSIRWGPPACPPACLLEAAPPCSCSASRIDCAPAGSRRLLRRQ